MHGLESNARVNEPESPKHPREVQDTQSRFHGKSSSLHLIGPTREFKLRHMEENGKLRVSLEAEPTKRRQLYWNSLPVG